MGFRTFVLIVIAVALGVNRWLKFHENPESFDNLLELIWAIIKFLVKVWFILLVVGWIGYWIYLLINWIWDLGIEITVPDRVGMLILVIFFGWIFIWWFLIKVKEKWWFKSRLKYKKEKRIAKKKRRIAEKKAIANLKWEEKKRYEKNRRDGRIIVICLSIVFAPWIILTILKLLGIWPE